MARYSVSDRAAGIGAVGLPFAALQAAATNGCAVREVEVVNLSSTAVEVKLVRLFSAGTPGAQFTGGKYNPNSNSPQCQVFNTYSASPTTQDAGYSTMIPGIPGIGEIWAFGDTGLVINAGTTNGLGICVACNAGQLCRFRFTWDE